MSQANQVSELANYELVSKIIKKRKSKSLYDIPLPDHELIGTWMVNRETGKRYIVEKARQHWYWGYYIILSIRREGTDSHAVVMWENLTCDKDSLIAQQVRKARNRYEHAGT